MPELGTKAPEFSLKDQKHATRTLSEFQGSWLILYFYPKDDTPGCTKEACGFTESLPEFTNLKAKVLGVSPDSPEKHQKFIEKYSLKIDLLSDPEKACLEAYDAWGVKKNYGKEYEGVIRSTFIIDPEGTIVASWRNVRVNGHVEQVRQKLEEAQANAEQVS